MPGKSKKADAVVYREP